MSWRLQEPWPPGVVPDELAQYGIGPRLAAVIAEIPEGSETLDVGTDHGLLPIALVGSGRSSARGVDVSPGAIRGARANRVKFGVPVELRVADGIDLSAEVVVVAGIGGQTISRLLQRGPERYVLQPNRDADYVRRALAAIGYRVERERFVAERDRFYVVMSAVRATPYPLTDEAAFVGGLRGDPLFEMWAQIQRRHLEKTPGGDPRLHFIGGSGMIGGR